MAEQNERTSSGKGMRWMVILLLITNIITLYLVITKQQEIKEIVIKNTDLVVEKDNLTQELNAMLAKYDSVSTDNAEMQAEIAEQKAQIEKLLAEAEKHKGDAWAIHKLKKEAATLRDVMRNYLVTIDSLNSANQRLITEKQQVESELSNKQTENVELSQQNEELSQKVKIGSKLRVVDLVAEGQRVKNSTVHRETDRANRVDKIKTCFTIDRNEVTKPGKKQVFLRIIGPNGEVLSYGQTRDYMFTYDGKEGLFSRKEEILYENEEMDMCLYWDVQNELKEGKYLVEVYAEDYMMGTTSFVLK